MYKSFPRNRPVMTSYAPVMVAFRQAGEMRAVVGEMLAKYGETPNGAIN
jgi:hypothetical protein